MLPFISNMFYLVFIATIKGALLYLTSITCVLVCVECVCSFQGNLQNESIGDTKRSFVALYQLLTSGKFIVVFKKDE